MGGPVTTIKVYKGNVDFIDSTKFWFDSLDQDLVFENQFNEIITFKKGIFNSSSGQQNVGNTYYGESNGCDEADKYYDYFEYPIHEYKFESAPESIKIVYTKSSGGLNFLYSNPTFKDKTPDALIVYVNDYGFNISPPSTSPRMPNKIFDTLTLGGKLYSKVIYTFRDTTGLSGNISPAGIFGVYYVIPKGLVGYEYNNGVKCFAK